MDLSEECRKFRSRIDAYIDTLLRPEEELAMELHKWRCDACRDILHFESCWPNAIQRVQFHRRTGNIEAGVLSRHILTFPDQAGHTMGSEFPWMGKSLLLIAAPEKDSPRFRVLAFARLRTMSPGEAEKREGVLHLTIHESRGGRLHAHLSARMPDVICQGTLPPPGPEGFRFPTLTVALERK